MPESYEELLKSGQSAVSIGQMPGQAALKSLLMIFIVDNSGSMGGDRMDEVNAAFAQMIPELQNVQVDAGDSFELSIAVLTFGTDAHWTVPPTPVMAYVHEPIVADGGGTQYGNMLQVLRGKLTREAYIPSAGKVARPYILLLTDGQPLDNQYDKVLKELRNNLWFDHAERYAVLIGHEAVHSERARTAVEAFVSEPGGIITAEDAREIVSKVEAHTLKTIRMMTNRLVQDGEAGEIRKPQEAGEIRKADAGAAGQTFGEIRKSEDSGAAPADAWRLPDDIYGKNYSDFPF